MDFIDNQNIFGDMPYGSRGTVADNGCGSIACHNYLCYKGYNSIYLKTYKFFNKNRRLMFFGKLGTNPFAIKRYLRKEYGLKVKMHFFNIPDKKLDSCIVLYFFKHKNKLNAHYMFAHKVGRKYKTYNLNHSYSSIKSLLKHENAHKDMFVIYEIIKK